jgi:2'-5' RNA ligase
VFVKLNLPKNISKELSAVLPESTARFTRTPHSLYHITTLYLGKPGESKLNTIVDKIEAVCNNQPKLSANIEGLGYFKRYDNSIITYASVNCPGLDLLRADLFRAVNPISPVPNTFGFTAHVTLYNGQAPIGIISKLPDTPWIFEGLKVDFGDGKAKNFLFNQHLS